MDSKIETVKQKMYTASASCKRCFGRGYIGTDQQGRKVGCRCVKVTYVDQPVIKPVKPA